MQQTGRRLARSRLYSLTATHGGSSRCRSSYATKSLTNSVRRAACFTLEHLRCLSAWFSLSATPWSCRWPHMSYGRFCRVSATLRLHMKDSACSWGAYAACNHPWVRRLSGSITPGRSPQEQYRAENAQPRAAPRTLATLIGQGHARRFRYSSRAVASVRDSFRQRFAARRIFQIR